MEEGGWSHPLRFVPAFRGKGRENNPGLPGYFPLGIRQYGDSINVLAMPSIHSKTRLRFDNRYRVELRQGKVKKKLRYKFICMYSAVSFSWILAIENDFIETDSGLKITSFNRFSSYRCISRVCYVYRKNRCTQV